MRLRMLWIALAIMLALAAPAGAQTFKVGFARRDITPEKSVPMWGYGGLGPRMSQGVHTRQFAKTVVIDTGDGHKLAMMGLDIGRGPNEAMLSKIRPAVKEASGIDFVLISGSHSHHGPVLELRDEEGKGKGKYDDAVAYVDYLAKQIIDAINEAAANAKDAKIGWADAHVPLCRNRHSKIEPKPINDLLTVFKFETDDGKPIAMLVNFSAHPTILPAPYRKFSAEWPGAMNEFVEKETGFPCMFMQGSAGDLSPNTSQLTDKIIDAMMKADAEREAKGETIDPDRKPLKAPAGSEGKKNDYLSQLAHDIYQKDAFGRQMADEVEKLAPTIASAKPAAPSIKGADEDFHFATRIDFKDNKLRQKFNFAFFPELVKAMGDDWADGITPHLTTILLNGNLALVGGSGEFFSNHAIRYRERLRTQEGPIKACFFGYCNGHHMYFPTIEGASEGGYGADATVSYVPVGAGEQMMNKALFNVYDWMGKFETKMPGN